MAAAYIAIPLTRQKVRFCRKHPKYTIPRDLYLRNKYWFKKKLSVNNHVHSNVLALYHILLRPYQDILNKILFAKSYSCEKDDEVMCTGSSYVHKVIFLLQDSVMHTIFLLSKL